VTVLLQGIVGSTAYGLDREGSDVDRLGVFAAPSASFWGLNPPTGKAATLVSHKPDLTLHEIGKFCALALQCNPTILELLWLPPELYEMIRQPGFQLITDPLRSAFLSRQRIRDAYFGYATRQFHRLSNRSRFPDVPVNRIEKHASHLWRLLIQGFQLHSTGSMTIKVKNPDVCFSFGERVAAGEIEIAEKMIADFEWSFDNATSPLSEVPDTGAVEDFLRTTRKALL
jgi:predicted nucleotidyltransferase